MTYFTVCTIYSPSLGKQCCIHGPAVNVPSKLDSVCELLPCLPSESELVPLKLKMKVKLQGSLSLRPDKLISADYIKMLLFL